MRCLGGSPGQGWGEGEGKGEGQAWQIALGRAVGVPIRGELDTPTGAGDATRGEEGGIPGDAGSGFRSLVG